MSAAACDPTDDYCKCRPGFFTHKVGSGGGRWIALEKPKPPKVEDHYAYWMEPPPALSPRCVYWMRQIMRGWRPNRRWTREGYEGLTQLFGVYMWEYLHVIYPLLRLLRAYDEATAIITTDSEPITT